jgi:transposase
MGQRAVVRESLFYSFHLDRHVPMDHLLRAIDRFVGLSGVHHCLEAFYGSIGRPSADPELMIRLLIVGYCFGLRSERRRCDEVHRNLVSRGFCRLSLDAPVPDPSTFSKARHGRFRHADVLRQVLETVGQRCLAEDLGGDEGFAVDAGLITADAHRQRRVQSPGGRTPEASRAVAEYPAVCDDVAFGAATDGPPKFLSPADPAARWTAVSNGPAVYASGDDHRIDLKCAVSLDVEPTTAGRQAEATAALPAPPSVSAASRRGWPPTLAMGRPKCWPGWSTSAELSRTSRGSTNQPARPAHCRAPMSPMTMQAIPTSARAASC